mmetsp:Transcript_5325/g.10148  ORF Transcript_5325/g.10148 Transcript_5325/m.10148 type:complete len:500 (-) Transcript_5325:2299-3798(-)
MIELSEEAVIFLQDENDEYFPNCTDDSNTIIRNSRSRDISFSLAREGKELITIAMPSIVVQLGAFLLYPQCASSIGRHLNSDALGAFSLGSLSGNMTCVSIIIGTLTASDTLQPRAFGLRQFNEVGLLAIRGFFMCSISLLLPITVLLTGSESILTTLGQDEQSSALASQWIKVYILSVPALLSFRVTQRFLACQNIVMPCVFGSVISCFLLHPFILKWAIENFGFIGSSWAIVITQSIQFFLCISFTVLTGTYEKETWPGLTFPIIAEALRFDQLARYAKLSFGGILSLSEWWFWESICFIAGKFSLIDLCVHTISYQLIPVAFMIPSGISIGLIVRLGIILPVTVSGAKRLTAYTMIFTVILATAVSAIIYLNQKFIVSLFTTDEIVIEGCEKIWTKLCIYNILLWIFCINKAILNALGLQWRTAVTMCLVLWCATIPTIQYNCVNIKDGFYLMWSMLPWSYAALNVGLIFSYVTADWEATSSKISKNDLDESIDTQ